MFWICDACPFGFRPDQDMAPTVAPYCDIRRRTDPQIWRQHWCHIDRSGANIGAILLRSVLLYRSWAVRTWYVCVCFGVTSLECCETRHRYSMATCSYLCLPKRFGCKISANCLGILSLKCETLVSSEAFRLVLKNCFTLLHARIEIDLVRVYNPRNRSRHQSCWSCWSLVRDRCILISHDDSPSDYLRKSE